jgi:hypothetical protein
MTSFTARDADAILINLGAEIHHSEHTVGFVGLTQNRRIRLYHGNHPGDLPTFVYQKWKQALKLSDGEMRSLAHGRLEGEAALALIRKRYGV